MKRVARLKGISTRFIVQIQPHLMGFTLISIIVSDLFLYVYSANESSSQSTPFTQEKKCETFAARVLRFYRVLFQD